MTNTKNPLYEFGPYQINIDTGRLWQYGQVIHLNSRERKLLLVLVEASIEKGGSIVEPIDSLTLIRKVWGRVDQVETTAVHQVVSRLREQIGDEEKNIIETVPSEGYRLGVPVVPKILSETTRGAEAGINDLRFGSGSSQATASLFKLGSAPPRPSLIIGRKDELRELKKRLMVNAGNQSTTTVQVLTAVRGWPGVGKTTLAAALAHDPAIAAAFPDGVLWASLGQYPDIFSELTAWGRALGVEDLLRAKSLEEASARLTALLLDKRVLLIVDDVWKTEHAIPFNVGGLGCAKLITTRITRGCY